jgi:hypothetical protein
MSQRLQLLPQTIPVGAHLMGGGGKRRGIIHEYTAPDAKQTVNGNHVIKRGAIQIKAAPWKLYLIFKFSLARIGSLFDSSDHALQLFFLLHETGLQIGDLIPICKDMKAIA